MTNEKIKAAHPLLDVLVFCCTLAWVHYVFMCRGCSLQMYRSSSIVLQANVSVHRMCSGASDLCFSVNTCSGVLHSPYSATHRPASF